MHKERVTKRERGEREIKRERKQENERWIQKDWKIEKEKERQEKGRKRKIIDLLR